MTQEEGSKAGQRTSCSQGDDDPGWRQDHHDRDDRRDLRSNAHMLTSAPSPVPLPLASTNTRRRVVVTLGSCSSLRSSGCSGPRKRPCERSLPPDLLVDEEEEKRPMVRCWLRLVDGMAVGRERAGRGRVLLESSRRAASKGPRLSYTGSLHDWKQTSS